MTIIYDVGMYFEVYTSANASLHRCSIKSIQTRKDILQVSPICYLLSQ